MSLFYVKPCIIKYLIKVKRISNLYLVIENLGLNNPEDEDLSEEVYNDFCYFPIQKRGCEPNLVPICVLNPLKPLEVRL
jgi:hypothetical protein